MSKTPKIVILGAGYGGIVTAIRLEKELNYNEADITLVNKHDYHYITTHLHKPAAGTDDPENARIDISKLIDKLKVDFVKSTVKQIKPQEKVVVLEDRELTYDYLVIGLGGEPETFGIPGLLEHALNIRSINSVRFISTHIEYQFARYKREPARTDYLTFIVGGAGFTGIEFLGELTDRVPELCNKFDVDPMLVKIINVEAAPSILSGFSQELVDYARNVLEKKGVVFKIATAIKECNEKGVFLADGEFIQSSTVIWTGGIRGNRLIESAGFETTRGRVLVDAYLRAPGYDDVFILGDSSIVMNEQNKPYPPTAQIATQQGKECAYNLAALIRYEPLREFKFHNKGVVASLGKGEAVASIGSKQVKGGLASMLKKIVDLRYIYTIGGISLVIKNGRF